MIKVRDATERSSNRTSALAATIVSNRVDSISLQRCAFLLGALEAERPQRFILQELIFTKAASIFVSMIARTAKLDHSYISTGNVLLEKPYLFEQNSSPSPSYQMLDMTKGSFHGFCNKNDFVMVFTNQDPVFPYFPLSGCNHTKSRYNPKLYPNPTFQ